jgi:hypothetical protein
MLTALTLENFKGYKGFHKIPLSKITLLYGENSSDNFSAFRLNMNKIGAEQELLPKLDSYQIICLRSMPMIDLSFLIIR